MATGRREGRPTPVNVRPGRRSGPVPNLDLSQAAAKLRMAEREKRAAATRGLARVEPRSAEAIDILARLIKSRAWPKPRGLERVSATQLLATFKTEADFQGTINDVSTALALMDVVHDIPSRRDYSVAMVKAAPRKYRKKLARREERVRGWLEAARQEEAAAAVAIEQETLLRWATWPATSPTGAAAPRPAGPPIGGGKSPSGSRTPGSRSTPPAGVGRTRTPGAELR